MKMSNIICGRCKKVIGTERSTKSDVIREYNQSYVSDYRKDEFVCMECNEINPVSEKDQDPHLPWKRLEK
jgi:hypothetical protein